jgi:hypothetical protein
MLKSQPVSKGTEVDVARIVARDFPAGEVVAVMHILDLYGSKDWHVEIDRVRLAALKLAEGRLDVLQDAVQEASVDFRDVVGPAEYPNYDKLNSTTTSSDAAKEQAIADDWKQYSEWLTRTRR